MVNTRILETRLGWRRGAEPAAGGHATSDGPSPAASQPQRRLGHEPVLQGRIQPGRNRPRLETAGAAAAWEALPELAPSLESAVARLGALPPIARNAPSARLFDQLRSQVLRVAQTREWKRIGITAPRRGGGASFVALGLAASLARLDYMRSLLADLDLAQPSIARHAGFELDGPLEELLRAGRIANEDLCRVGGNLALLLNDTPVPAAADLLYSPDAILALRHLGDGLAPGLIIADMPPLLSDPAATALLPLLDAVLLVADGSATTPREITECERILEGQVPLLGVVLNKSEDRPAPAGQG